MNEATRAIAIDELNRAVEGYLAKNEALSEEIEIQKDEIRDMRDEMRQNLIQIEALKEARDHLGVIPVE